MSVIDKLKSAAVGLKNRLTAAAKDEARAQIVPALLLEKGIELAKVDGQLQKLGWSPNARQQRAELTAQRTRLAAEYAALKSENDQSRLYSAGTSLVKAQEEAVRANIGKFKP